MLGSKDGVPTVVSLYHDHQPGETSTHHTHPWEHQAFITEGSGTLFFAGEEYSIKTGDCIYVPASIEHQFRNTGDVRMSRVTVNPISSIK